MASHIVRRVGLAVLLLLLASACSGSSKQEQSSDVVLSSELRVLDGATLAQLSAVSADQSTLTFDAATEQLSALKQGNVIAAGVVPKLLPQGMLRTVVSVSGNGPLTVTTGPASITDAIVKGSINPSFHLTPEQATSAGLHTAAAGGSDSGLTYGFDKKVIHDGDGDPSTTNDQILLSGSISIDPLVNFPIQIDSGFKKVDLDISGAESASLTLTAQEGASFDKRVDLYTQLFPVITIDVAGLPVVLIPELTFYAGMNGSASATLTTGVNEQAKLDVGVGYQDGNFGPFNHSTASGSFDPPNFAGGASAQAKASAGARLSIALWGLPAAYVDADVFVRADVEPAKDPWWSLYGGAEGHAGVGFPGLSYDAPLGSVEKLLASAPGGSPAASITNWARAYSGDSTDRLSTVVPIAGGGWLAGGTTLSFSSTPADAWLVATDAIGEPMWQRAFDDLDSVRALCATSDGDYLVATGTTDPGVGGLLKVDANGAVSWSKSVTDAGSAGVKINDMVATPDGGALLGGTLGEYSAADYWVAKIDAQAQPVWSFRYGGNGEDDLHALVATGDGGVLAVGTSESFTPLPLTWAVRLDADGKVLWQKSYDSGGDLYGERAVAATSGGFFVGGENVLDAMALRLDDSGNVSWATNIASSSQDASINGAANLPGGGFAVAGSENSNAWIVALDSGGSVTWSHQYGGAGDEGIGGMQELHGIGDPLLSEPDGTLIAAGASSSFGSGHDGWLLETTPNGNVTFSGSGGAQETNPSGSYPPLALTTATTSVAAAVAPLTVSELTVKTSSTEASTISQAP